MIDADSLLARSLSRLTTGLLLVGVVLVVAVHPLSDLDPIGHRMSEYVLGPGGPLMFAAFLALGVGVVALGGAIGLTGPRGWRTRVVAGTLAAAGLSLVVAGVAPTDPGAATSVEAVHSGASAVATLAIVGVALGWSRTMKPRHRGLCLLAVVAAGLTVLSVILHDTAVAGLGQRLLWITLVAWLLLTARVFERTQST